MRDALVQGIGSPEAVAGLLVGGLLLLGGVGGAWSVARSGGAVPASSPMFWALLCAPLAGVAVGVWASARRAAAERRLRDQRNRLRDELDQLERRERVRGALFDAASAAVLACDERGVVVAGNPAAEWIFGYDGAALRRVAIGELLPDLASLEDDDGLPRFSAAGELLGREWRTRGRHRDGTVFPVQLERARLEALHLDMVTVREATTVVDEEQRRVREALRSEQDRLVDLSKHRSEFLHRVGRELRGHLHVVLTRTDELAAGATRDSALAMLVIVDKLLNLGMVDDSVQRLYPEPVAVPGLLEELVHSLQPLVQRNGNTLDVRVSDQVPILTVDRQKLAHALRNLLSNAARYTRDGRITVEVVVEPGRGTDWIAFFVSDTGAGLSPRELDQLFEAFSLPDAASTQEYLAVGTGLALSQHCARLLGGHIAVRSAAGEGSTFTLRVPLQRDPPTRTRMLHISAEPRDREPQASPGASLPTRDGA